MSKVKFKANLDSLYDMLAYVREASEKAAFAPSIISRIELALEEALVNIIRYAYPENEAEEGWINIECNHPAAGGIQIVVRDRGIAYNSLTYAPQINPADTLEERSTDGGYGIFFITHLMDEVNYQREDGGNVLTLTMHKKAT